MIATATYIFKKTLSRQWGGAFVWLWAKLLFFLKAQFPPVQKNLLTCQPTPQRTPFRNKTLLNRCFWGVFVRGGSLQPLGGAACINMPWFGGHIYGFLWCWVSSPIVGSPKCGFVWWGAGWWQQFGMIFLTNLGRIERWTFLGTTDISPPILALLKMNCSFHQMRYVSWFPQR